MERQKALEKRDILSDKFEKLTEEIDELKMLIKNTGPDTDKLKLKKLLKKKKRKLSKIGGPLYILEAEILEKEED